MKRIVLAAMLLVLMASVAFADDWFEYQGSLGITEGSPISYRCSVSARESVDDFWKGDGFIVGEDKTMTDECYITLGAKYTVTASHAGDFESINDGGWEYNNEFFDAKADTIFNPAKVLICKEERYTNCMSNVSNSRLSTSYYPPTNLLLYGENTDWSTLIGSLPLEFIAAGIDEAGTVTECAPNCCNNDAGNVVSSKTKELEVVTSGLDEPWVSSGTTWNGRSVLWLWTNARLGSNKNGDTCYSSTEDNLADQHYGISLGIDVKTCGYCTTAKDDGSGCVADAAAGNKLKQCGDVSAGGATLGNVCDESSAGAGCISAVCDENTLWATYTIGAKTYECQHCPDGQCETRSGGTEEEVGANSADFTALAKGAYLDSFEHKNIHSSSGLTYVDKIGIINRAEADFIEAGAGDTYKTYWRAGHEYWFASNGNEQYDVNRAYLYFDTSTLPAGAQVKSATLKLYGYKLFFDSSIAYSIEARGDDSGSRPKDPLTKGDFDLNHYFYKEGNAISKSEWSTLGYNPISVAPGLVSIDGTTKLVVLSSMDADLKVMTWGETADNQCTTECRKGDYVEFYSSHASDAAKKPKLVVTYD